MSLQWDFERLKRHSNAKCMTDTKSDFSIRPGCPEDARRVHELIQPFVQKGLLLDRTVDEIAELTTCSIAAECNGNLIGFAAVEVYSPKLAEIQCLSVAAEFQDRGVGKALVDACVQLARENNVLELMAISSSKKFLKACGFDYSLPGQKRALFINP